MSKIDIKDIDTKNALYKAKARYEEGKLWAGLFANYKGYFYLPRIEETKVIIIESLGGKKNNE